MKKISREFKEIYYSVGLHPLEAEKWEQSSKSLLRKSAQEDRRVVAIGELGLDFFKNKNLVKTSLNKAFSLIDKAVKKNVLHKNNGANRKSKINNFVKITLTKK